MRRTHPREGGRLRRVLAAFALLTLATACASSTSEDEPSPTAAGTFEPSVTEAPATEPPTTAPLADGRHFGYVKAIDPSRKTAVFDLAYFLTGEEADRAAQEDGVIQEGEHVDNDYYIVNENTKLRDILYASVVPVRLVRWSECCESFDAEFDLFVRAFQPGGTDENYKGPDSQYWLTVNGGVVTSVEEQFLP